MILILEDESDRIRRFTKALRKAAPIGERRVEE